MWRAGDDEVVVYRCALIAILCRSANSQAKEVKFGPAHLLLQLRHTKSGTGAAGGPAQRRKEGGAGWRGGQQGRARDGRVSRGKSRGAWGGPAPAVVLCCYAMSFASRCARCSEQGRVMPAPQPRRLSAWLARSIVSDVRSALESLPPWATSGGAPPLPAATPTDWPTPA